jgi:arylsulfatase A-like enzyme
MSDKPTLSSIPQFDASEVAGLEEEHRSRLESLLAVDEAVERLVNVLSELGELERTVILFTSDNGYFSGEHRLNTKFVSYEEAVKVPLLARGPGLPEGTAVDVPTQNVDLAPTIVSIAQAIPGREPDGIALLDVIERPQHYAKRPLYVASGPSEATSLRGLGYYPVYFGVQAPGLSYIRWANGDEELYDLVEDPYQVSNAVQDSHYRTEKRDLSDLASAFVNCSGDACSP